MDERQRKREEKRMRQERRQQRLLYMTFHTDREVPASSVLCHCNIYFRSAINSPTLNRLLRYEEEEEEREQEAAQQAGNSNGVQKAAAGSEREKGENAMKISMEISMEEISMETLPRKL